MPKAYWIARVDITAAEPDKRYAHRRVVDGHDGQR
jgi:uncharacterized protein (DUF1330 family)